MIDDQPTHREDKVRPRLDLAHLIKWIILIFLVLLLFIQLGSGEWRQLKEGLGWPWLILLLKLLLIFIVIWLMKVQRHLFCEVTEPTGCGKTEYDAASDSVVVVVKGRAGGTIFSHYTLALELTGTPLPITIDYPGGGASGVVPVNPGELGRLHVTTLEPTTGYKVILTVHGSSGATRTCFSFFDLQERLVYIEKIGAVATQIIGAHPSDPTEPLKLVTGNPGPVGTPPDPEISVGGSISVEGGADVLGCGRQMNEWALQHLSVASGSDPWQADAAGPWDDICVLPIWNTDPNHPRRYLMLGTLFPNFVVNGKLTRKWRSRQLLQTLFPPTYAPRRRTEPLDWGTADAPLNGRFTVRLKVSHDQMLGGGPIEELYDAATVWLDNRMVHCLITNLSVAGGAPLNACEELRLSNFVVGGSKVDMEIIGRAWDPIILDSYPAIVPNDNFGHYDLKFKKDGSSTYVDIVTGQTSPVPPDRQVALPAPDVGTLASWDVVGALDAGPPGSPPTLVPYPKIYRGDRCAYLLRLYVTDTTRLGDSGDTHDLYFHWPFCIENDLPVDAPFPMP